MNLRYLAIITLLLLFYLAGGVVKAAEYQVPLVPSGSIVPDGDIREWPERFFRPMDSTAQFPLWAAAYDTSFLHLALQVQDATPEFSDYLSPDFLGNDSVVFILGSSRPLELSVTYFTLGNQTVLLPVQKGYTGVLKPSLGGYVLELSIHQSVFSGFRTKDSLKIQILVLDLDQGILKRVYSLGGKGTGWRDPDSFATLIF